MASSKILAILALALVCCVQGTLSGGLECENLNKDSCAFAVSSSGKRCILEKNVRRSGEEVFTCRSSEIEAGDNLKEWIETDHCVEACGLDRTVLGISSDSLLDSRFADKLCSSQCYHGCPNIVDLYFNLAAGEGVFLPKLCEAKGANARRGMAEIQSSGIIAPGPESGGDLPAAKYYMISPSPESGLPPAMPPVAKYYMISPGPESGLPPAMPPAAKYYTISPGPEAGLAPAMPPY